MLYRKKLLVKHLTNNHAQMLNGTSVTMYYNKYCSETGVISSMTSHSTAVGDSTSETRKQGSWTRDNIN